MENFDFPDSVAQTNICPSKPAVATCAQQVSEKEKSAKVVGRSRKHVCLAPFQVLHVVTPKCFLW